MAAVEPFRPPTSVAESIAATLRDRLASGIYAPGTWIRESSLAEEFKFSNGPIREALQTLVNEGLLVREPWKGVRVVHLSDNEIVEIFELRLALQEQAAELAVHFATDDQLKEARALLDQMKEVLERGDIEAQMPLGGRLSQWLCSCSGNSRLEQNWSRLTYLTRMYIYASLRDSKDLRSVAIAWEQLVTAIEQRDVSAARQSVRNLVRRTLRDLGLQLRIDAQGRPQPRST